jgi:hypothetical protein
LVPKEETMAVIKRISPGSAFKVGLVVYAFLGLLIGVLVACLSFLAGSSWRWAGSGIIGPAAFGVGVGLVSIIISPILYGLIGGVVAAIVAALYNLAAGWVGGLQIDLE